MYPNTPSHKETWAPYKETAKLIKVIKVITGLFKITEIKHPNKSIKGHLFFHFKIQALCILKYELSSIKNGHF